METVAGGPTADYTYAVRLLEAVCPGNEVEAELDRHSRELDDFFARPDSIEHLHVITEMLLDQNVISGEVLRKALFEYECGALHPDGEHRCIGRPHRAGDHSYRDHTDAPWSWTWVSWDSFGMPDKTPKSKHTPRQRAVLRTVEPDLYPPRRSDPPDVPTLAALQLHARQCDHRPFDYEEHDFGQFSAPHTRS